MSSSFAASALIKQNVTYLDIVAAAVLMYDYLLTVEREARLVWPVPMSFGKVLFFVTRYPVFADTFMVLYHQFAVMSPAACQGIFRTIGFLLGVGTLIAESILAVRTWVIWQRNRRIAAILIVAIIACWIPVFFFLKIALYSLVFTSPPSPNTPGCFLSKQNPILWVVFVILMVFETLILALTLLKGIEHFRVSKSPLVSVLYRDGILNYVYLCILSIINVVVLLTAPHGYSTLLTATQRVFHSIFSARILLHLREAAVRGQSTASHFTSEMGPITIPRSQKTGGTSTSSNTTSSGSGLGNKKRKHVGRGGATYPNNIGLETETETDGTYSFSHTATTMSASSRGGARRGYGVPPGIGVGEEEEIGPEDLFGEKAEGELPETVTWFGDNALVREEVGAGGGGEQDFMELGQVRRGDGGAL